MRGLGLLYLLVIHSNVINTEKSEDVILSTISDIISQLNSSAPENYQQRITLQENISRANPLSYERSTGNKRGERKSRQIVDVPLLWRNALLPQLKILVTPPLRAVQGKLNQTLERGEQSKVFGDYYQETPNRIVTCYASNRRPFEGYACDEENCVPREWVCDGERDCDSGADEANCQENYCMNGQFRCVARGKHVCLSADRMCDGHIDCQDGSDEDLRNCRYPAHEYCHDGYFRCRNGQGCILLDDVCDREDDCSDGSDEQNCRYPAHHSCNSKYHFQCYRGYSHYNLKCIPRRWLCDQHNDCPGGEDELLENCRPSSSNTLHRTFKAFLLFPGLDTSLHTGDLIFPSSQQIVKGPVYK